MFPLKVGATQDGEAFPWCPGVYMNNQECLSMQICTTPGLWNKWCTHKLSFLMEKKASSVGPEKSLEVVDVVFLKSYIFQL